MVKRSLTHNVSYFNHITKMVYAVAVSCLVSVHISHALSVHELSRSADSRHMMYKQARESEAIKSPIIKLGNHVIAEFMGCVNLDAFDELEQVLRDAAVAAHATVINVMTYKFSPQGMTGLVLLSESHISIHTWPEYGYASIDIYTCGEHVDINAAIESLKAFFKPKTVRQIIIDRGYDKSFDTQE